jgi:hypothetical protein
MIQNFETTLTLGDQEVKFTFNPVNAYHLQLFQVYTIINEKEVRFHMQTNEKGEFQITDPYRLPDAYVKLEAQLVSAIHTQYPEETLPTPIP